MGGLKRVVGEPGGTVLLLRAFLGVTFTFAGCQKLANPDFFNAAAPGSFQEQLHAAIATSPLHHLLDPVLHAATAVAVVIAFAEIAVGLGTLAGLFGRLAALGGALLSLSFFLTVSFNDSPYYYGADIVFLFAWSPLLIGGPGRWSLDDALRRRPIRHATRRGSAALGDRLERRAFLQRTTSAALLGVVGLALGGFVAALGRQMRDRGRSSQHTALGGTPDTISPTSGAPGTTSPTSGTSGSSPAATTPSATTPSTTTPPASQPAGTAIGPASDVPVGQAASFTDPASQEPAYVVQVHEDVFRAFSAVCPHAGCTVQYQPSADVFACPCHGSMFNGDTGAVIQGPATRGLTPIPISLAPDGQLYVDG